MTKSEIVIELKDVIKWAKPVDKDEYPLRYFVSIPGGYTVIIRYNSVTWNYTIMSDRYCFPPPNEGEKFVLVHGINYLSRQQMAMKLLEDIARIQDGKFLEGEQL